MSVNILPPRVFRVKEAVAVWPEFGAPRIIEAETLLWQHSARQSSIDGYIGTYSLVYVSAGAYHPKPGPTWKMKTDFMEAVV